jgi:hypothetical protein
VHLKCEPAHNKFPSPPSLFLTPIFSPCVSGLKRAHAEIFKRAGDTFAADCKKVKIGL